MGGGTCEMVGRGKTRNKGSRMTEFALMRAGGSQSIMAVSIPCLHSFLQALSIWLICPLQLASLRRLCAVMHSRRLCVCLSVRWDFLIVFKHAH